MKTKKAKNTSITTIDESEKPFLYASRLVDRLSTLEIVDIKSNHIQMVEKFGQLVDFSGSITLSMMHEGLENIEFKPNRISVETIKKKFLQDRSDLVGVIGKSFISSSGISRNRIPGPNELHAYYKLKNVYEHSGPISLAIQKTVYEPFRKFYTDRQQYLGSTIRQLRSHVTQMISGLSPELAQLSTIDIALNEVLLKQTQKLLALPSQFLGIFFMRMLETHWEEFKNNATTDHIEALMGPGGWIYEFCNEMREILLAELEVRLLPVVGMIDSLPQTDNIDILLDDNKGNKL